MMIVCGILVGIAFIVIGLTYCFFRIAFYVPDKKKRNVYDIPDSRLYKNHRDKLLKQIDEMEKIPHKKVRITSDDGVGLCGRMYNVRDNAPVLIAFHGYRGNYAWDGYGFFKVCHEMGINIIMIDERAHGESGGNVITFGIKERYDCVKWIQYVIRTYGESINIILAGVSMGASTILMATELGLPANVKGIISDCAYSRPGDIIRQTIRNMGLPLKIVYPLVKMGAHIFGHFNIEDASPVESVEKLGIPTLFIHGSEDSVVPLAMGDILYEKCSAKKRRIIIDRADHANSALVDYDIYSQTVKEFIIRDVKDY